jgi:hypothetical protein
MKRSFEEVIHYARRMVSGQKITVKTEENLSDEYITRLKNELSQIRKSYGYYGVIRQKRGSLQIKFHSKYILSSESGANTPTITEVFYQCFKMNPGERCTFIANNEFVSCIPWIEEDLALIEGKSYKLTKCWKSKKFNIYNLNILCVNK